MKFGKNVMSFAVIFILTVCFNTMAFAGDCDWCVCKGNDTANSCTKCCKAAEELGIKPTKLELLISDDGKAIVDQDGKEVARFVKDIKVQVATKGIKASNQKLPGCWHCYPECVVWDGNRCVQWVRTCDWDFDWLAAAYKSKTGYDLKWAKIIGGQEKDDKGYYVNVYVIPISRPQGKIERNTVGMAITYVDGEINAAPVAIQ